MTTTSTATAALPTRRDRQMGSVKVKIRTSDIKWAQAHGFSHEDEGRGDGYALVTVEVPAVERVKFCGRDMVRFDLGADIPRDCPNRWAMYPASYVVA